MAFPIILPVKYELSHTRNKIRHITHKIITEMLCDQSLVSARRNWFWLLLSALWRNLTSINICILGSATVWLILHKFFSEPFKSDCSLNYMFSTGGGDYNPMQVCLKRNTQKSTFFLRHIYQEENYYYYSEGCPLCKLWTHLHSVQVYGRLIKAAQQHVTPRKLPLYPFQPESRLIVFPALDVCHHEGC